MPTKDRSMQKQLGDADLFLSNIYKEDLLNTLKAWRYDEEELYKGKGLYAHAIEMMEEKGKLERDYRGANSRFQEASKAARKYFINTLILARRRMSSEPALQRELKLKGDTPRTFQGWTSKADHLYRTAVKNPEIMALLKRDNLDGDYLEQGAGMITDLYALNAAQTDIKGKSQLATVERKKAVKELHTWYQDLSITCRAVFREDPKQLIRLGIEPLKKS